MSEALRQALDPFERARDLVQLWLDNGAPIGKLTGLISSALREAAPPPPDAITAAKREAWSEGREAAARRVERSPRTQANESIAHEIRHNIPNPYEA